MNCKKFETKELPCYFQEYLDGKKTFGMRYDMVDAKVGDKLVLLEWNEEKQMYTGRRLELDIVGVRQTGVNRATIETAIHRANNDD